MGKINDAWIGDENKLRASILLVLVLPKKAIGHDFSAKKRLNVIFIFQQGRVYEKRLLISRLFRRIFAITWILLIKQTRELKSFAKGNLFHACFPKKRRDMAKSSPFFAK